MSCRDRRAFCQGRDPVGTGAVPQPSSVFDHCRFERAADVEATDVVYAIDSPIAGGTVLLRSPTLGVGLRDFFAPGCQGCQLE